MGLRERILFRNCQRPRKEFRVPDQNLDLSAGAVGSFRLDSHTETLKKRLGPPGSWKRWREIGEWFYPRLGVWFEGGDGLIVGINLVVRNVVDYCPGRGKLWEP